MKKLLMVLSLVINCCLSAFSQATSMTVDCQTPGWLSSMINYGDQQTLKNLKVTGYINATDLSFIGSLSKNQQLNGVINLEDVQIVGNTNDNNNKITKGYFGGHIQHLILPKSLVSATTCLSGATFDSLTIGGDALPVIVSGLLYSSGSGISFNKSVKHLILREGVTTIEKNVFYNNGYNQALEDECVFESIDIPSTVTSIGESAFRNNYALKKAFLSDNVEIIGNFAFKGTKLYSDNDTIILPQKLKYFYFSSFAIGSDGTSTSTHIYYGFANQHVFVPKSVEVLDASYIYLWGAYEKCYLHIANENPPILYGMTSGMYQYLVAYVPKNSVDIYKSDPSWKNVTILAEPNPAKSINIEQEYVEIIKNHYFQLTATVLPEDADDKSYTWSSSNSNVAYVSQEGLVTAQSSGKAMIYATLNVNNSIIDSCSVKVYLPVETVTLEKHNVSLKVGETDYLYAQITPATADNKEIEWSSSDEEIVSVDASGNITALKAGAAWVKAVSKDNAEAKDSCRVTVVQPVTGITLSQDNYSMLRIGETLQLEATVLPEDALNKEVRWSSSNENVCLVINGLVVGIGYGTTIITASTIEGGYSASCVVRVLEKGDANGDGVINYLDPAAVAYYIVGRFPTNFIFTLADVNEDGKITISDAVGIVKIMMEKNNASSGGE